MAGLTLEGGAGEVRFNPPLCPPLLSQGGTGFMASNKQPEPVKSRLLFMPNIAVYGMY